MILAPDGLMNGLLALTSVAVLRTRSPFICLFLARSLFISSFQEVRPSNVQARLGDDPDTTRKRFGNHPAGPPTDRPSDEPAPGPTGHPTACGYIWPTGDSTEQLSDWLALRPIGYPTDRPPDHSPRGRTPNQFPAQARAATTAHAGPSPACTDPGQPTSV